MCSGIEPREPLPQKLNVEFTALKIDSVEVSDFEFTALRRLEAFCKPYDSVVVKVQPCNAVIAFGLFRLLLD